MAYGITSESQIIDINTIVSGCRQFIEALDSFTKSGDTVISAGKICSKKALSVDDSSLEGSITQVGEEIKELKETFAGYAEDLIAEARNVYNAQVAEYNQYLQQLQAQQQQQQNSGY